MFIRTLGVGLMLSATLATNQNVIEILRNQAAASPVYAFGIAANSVSPSAAIFTGSAALSASVPLLCVLGVSLLLAGIFWPFFETVVDHLVSAVLNLARALFLRIFAGLAMRWPSLSMKKNFASLLSVISDLIAPPLRLAALCAGIYYVHAVAAGTALNFLWQII